MVCYVKYANFPGGNTPGHPGWEEATPSLTYPQHRGYPQARTQIICSSPMLNTNRRR